MEVRGLGEELLRLKLLGVPKRGTYPPDFCGLFTAFLVIADNCAQDERGCTDEGFGHLFFRLGEASVGKVSDIHGVARGVIVLLHYFNHQVTTLVHLDEGEDYATSRELSHLILDLEAIR